MMTNKVDLSSYHHADATNSIAMALYKQTSVFELKLNFYTKNRALNGFKEKYGNTIIDGCV